MDSDAMARLMAGLPVADLQLLAPLVASPDWKVQLRAVRALTRQPGEGPAPHKFEALVEGVAIRPLSLPIELAAAIASHDDARAVPLLLGLATEFPRSRAIWEQLARKAPQEAGALLLTLTDMQLMEIRDSMLGGPLAETLAKDPAPALVRRLIDLLPKASFAENLLRRMRHATICRTELLRAYQAHRDRLCAHSELVSDVGATAGIDALAGGLTDPSWNVRSSAARALARAGEPAFAALHQALAQGTPQVIDTVLDVLSSAHAGFAVPVLQRLVHGDNRSLQLKGMKVLARMAGAQAQDTLLPFTRSPSRTLRNVSVSALRDVPTPASVWALVELALSSDRCTSTIALASLRALCRTCPTAIDGMVAVFFRCAEARLWVVGSAVANSVRMHTAEWTAAMERLPQSAVRFAMHAPEAQQRLVLLDEKVSEAVALAQPRTDGVIIDPIVGLPPAWSTAAPPTLASGHDFEIDAPREVNPRDGFIIDVRCQGRDEDLWTRQQHWSNEDILAAPCWGEAPPDMVMSVSLSVPDCIVAQACTTVTWAERTGVARFELRPSPNARPGRRCGDAVVAVAGIPFARIRFMLDIAFDAGPSVRMQDVEQISIASLCFAPEDRDAVLGRIRSLLDVLPFLDVIPDAFQAQPSLDGRIDGCDAMLMFWSSAARQSGRVEAEWRKALAARGRDFVRLVLLDPVGSVPVPEDLSR